MRLGRSIVFALCGCFVIGISVARSAVSASSSGSKAAPAGETPIVPKYLGSGSCGLGNNACHVKEATWASKRDGDGKRQHMNAINQLNFGPAYPKAKGYATALGLDENSVFAGGACLKCHATPVGPDPAGEGVTCERCHGAGSDYLKPHAIPNSPPGTQDGMTDFIGKPGNWSKECLSCHALGPSADHRKLAAAGHPSGAEFDLRRKYVIVQDHWKTKYNVTEIAPFAAALVLEPPRIPKPETKEPPKEVIVTPPKETIVTPPKETTPPKVPVLVVDPPPPPLVTVRNAPVELPIRTEATPREREPERVKETPPGPPQPPKAPPAAPEGPTTFSGIVAAVQGRLIDVLGAFLRQGASVPQRVVPPPKRATFTGPDAELLRLQEEAIALALEVLGAAPGKGRGSK